MRNLAELGSGSFYYIEDPQAVEEVFEEEVVITEAADESDAEDEDED